MSVLVLSPFFYPEPISTGRYNTVLAQELVRQGETVDVITSHPLYPSWQPQRSIVQLPGMTIRRGGGWLTYPRPAVLRRLLLEVWFAAHVCLQLLRAGKPPTRVIAIFPPCAFMVLLPSLLPRSAIKIGIVHDLQGVLAERGGGRAGRLLRNVIGWIEKRAFTGCNRLIFLSKTMANRAIEEYSLDPTRCSVHYPFLTLPADGTRQGVALENVLPSGVIHIVYSGALGEKQEPGKLVAFMGELVRRHPGIQCHIFSGGPLFDRLRGDSVLGAGVAFHALVPETALDELYARSTIQLLPQAKGTSEGCLPSKHPKLLASGVPVFAICDDNSEIAGLLDQAGEGAAGHADGFDAPDLYLRFEALLTQSAADPREVRIAHQKLFVQERFGVSGVIDEILHS